MRQTNILTNKGPLESTDDWIGKALTEINEASGEQPAEHSADAFELNNFDEVNGPLTDFDVTSATLDDVRRILATLIFYIQKRGPDKTQ